MKRVSIILIGIILLIIITATILIEFRLVQNVYDVVIPSILLIAILVISILIIQNNKLYNVILYLLAFAVLGHLGRIKHLAGSGMTITLAYMGLSITCWYIAFKSRIKLKSNPFIKNLTSTVNITLSVVFIGTLFKIQHWPGGGFVAIIGIVSFVIYLLGIIFLLPNSNYIEWSNLDKKYFYRTIIIPSIYIFYILSTNLIFRDILQKKNQIEKRPSFLKEIEFQEREGLNKDNLSLYLFEADTKTTNYPML